MRTTPLAASLAIILAAFLSPPQTLKAEQEKEKPYALLRGTVFTAGGLALPGIPVTIKVKNESKPKWRAVSDGRGEFAVRLPVGHQTYEVSTRSKEHEDQTKTVEIHESESVNVIFRLALKEKKQEEDR